MKTRRNKKDNKLPVYAVVLVLVAYAASLVVAGLSYIVPVTQDLAVGDVAPRDFLASRQVENVFVTRQNREEAAMAVEPQVQHDPSITAEILDEVETFFRLAGMMRAEFVPIISPFETGSDALSVPDVARLNAPLTEEQFRYMLASDSAAFARFMVVMSNFIEETLERQILNTASLPPLILSLQDELSTQEFDDSYIGIGHVMAVEFLRPNMVVNEVETERLRQEAMDAANVVVILSGESVARQGDVIDEEAYLILVELGVIGVSAQQIITGLAGSWIIASIVFGLCLLYIFIFKKEMLQDKRQALMLFSLYMMAIVLMRVMVNLPFYFTPIMLFAMLCAILIDTRLSIVFTLALSMIAVVIDPINASLVVYIVINGTLAALIAKKIVVRSNMWMAAAVFVLANAATVFASYFLFTTGFSDQMLTSAAFAMIGGIMTIMLAYGSLPIWESMFKIVTQNTLLELTDPNNPLLRRLLIETPGTYHHSLVVANLAEAACIDIEANHVMARVGAYYHDIGKMKYPQYFAENQVDHNPHDVLPPLTSVDVINDHVTGGLALAREYKLPQPVFDFIEQHHGTSMMKVFFHKYKTANPDKKIDETIFRYNNRIPQTPETAVVMLADVCEAAVRSVFGKGDKDSSEIEAFVRKLIKDKFDDGQLNASGLSIKDLETIAEAFMKVFKGMHHERVPYPAGTVKELTAPSPGETEEVFKRR